MVLNRALAASILGFLGGEDEGVLGFVAGVVTPVGLHEHGVDLLQIDDFGAVAHGFDERARNHSPSNFPEIVLPFSARERRLRLEMMAYNLTARTSGNPAMRPKNRAWGFPRNGRVYPLGCRRQRLELRPKPRPTPTFFTPGIPQWPSRDPIEENGGLNLYGFVENDGADWVDILGMDSWVNPAMGVPGSVSGMVEANHDVALQRMEQSRKAERLRKEIVAHCLDCDKSGIIAEGRNKLKGYVEEFAKAKDKDLAPRGNEGSGANASCHHVNSELFQYFFGMSATIPCWSCSLVHRAHFRFPINYSNSGYRLGSDHWWIECSAYNSKGQVIETIAFDWWRNGATAGESPEINRKRYIQDLDSDPVWPPFYWFPENS